MAGHSTRQLQTPRTNHKFLHLIASFKSVRILLEEDEFFGVPDWNMS